MVRLHRLYRDANHCDSHTNQHALAWATRPELWAEHQIRYHGWTFFACEATVRQCRFLVNRITHAADRQGITPQQLVDTLPAPPQTQGRS